jgi:ribosomal protein S18 acetylase RimI-like enzyme
MPRWRRGIGRALVDHLLAVAAMRGLRRVSLEHALERAGDRARDDVALAKWVADSRTLIARPETFDYSAWCEGGLAREALAVS